MKDLKQQLIDATQDVKTTLLQQTSTWADKHYEYLAQINKYSAEQWCSYFNIEPRIVIEFEKTVVYYPKGFYNTKNARVLDTKLKESAVCRFPKESYIQSQCQKAEQHYLNSIDKLVFRIINKGMLLENISVRNSSIGVNLEVTILDGIKVVRAYTIIASGEIQKPHYRYLIK